MPAHNEDYPWPSYYGHFRFFENRLSEHSSISSWDSASTGLYEVSLYSGHTLKVFICECYCFGVAEFEETLENLESVDIIVINSTWCGYTDDAKFFCRDRSVGLFNIRDFMVALGQREYWLYLNEKDQERYREAGLI